MTEIDKTDRKILSILQGDGRIANVELAERIGLSPTSVGERLKRLQHYVQIISKMPKILFFLIHLHLS